MRNELFKESLVKNVSKFVPDAAEHIVQNKHMNDFEGEVPSLVWLEQWLLKYVDICAENYTGADSISGVGDCLVKSAKSYRKADGNEDAQKQKLIDALLVGFINDLFGRRCIDYAMYTSDLTK